MRACRVRSVELACQGSFSVQPGDKIEMRGDTDDYFPGVGVPEFWLTARNHGGISHLITECDPEVRKQLMNIRVSCLTEGRGDDAAATLGFKLALYFGPN